MMASVTALTPRWWESHLVRYGVGFFGGVVRVKFALMKLGLLFEFCLAPTVEPAAPVKSGATGAPTLFLLGALGLAYCYLTRVPGLVVLAVRRQLVGKAHWLLVAVLVGFIGLTLLACFVQTFMAHFYAVCLLTSFVFILTQVNGAWLERCSGTLSDFLPKPASSRFDYDLYRHVCEHGNTFLSCRWSFGCWRACSQRTHFSG